MNAFLMFRERPFVTSGPDGLECDVLADLGLDIVIDGMSDGDRTVADAARSALLSPLTEPDDILYREEVMEDAFALPALFSGIRDLCRETGERRRSSWCWFVRDDVTGMFSGAVSLLELYLEMTGRLRRMLDGEGERLTSRGMTGLRRRLDTRFGDDRLEEAMRHLSVLKENGGRTFSASFGPSLAGAGYQAVSGGGRHGRRPRFLTPSFTVSERDETGHDDMHARRERALNGIADILSRSAETFERFFSELETETSFYIGGLNIRRKLEKHGVPFAFPEPLAAASRIRAWRGLCDASLALTSPSPVVGNDMEECGASVYLITGANQGGKTTFLRSVGEAQLMMQAGLPVAAASFRAPVRKTVLTHFRREEDAGLVSGKLDEELRRMDLICSSLSPGSLLLMNESFSSTDGREGSIIATGITDTLRRHGVDIFSVTHLADYAGAFSGDGEACHLRAEHLSDGGRTFRIVPGMPERTAYGRDIWDRVFREGSGDGPKL